MHRAGTCGSSMRAELGPGTSAALEWKGSQCFVLDLICRLCACDICRAVESNIIDPSIGIDSHIKRSLNRNMKMSIYLHSDVNSHTIPGAPLPSCKRLRARLSRR